MAPLSTTSPSSVSSFGASSSRYTRNRSSSTYSSPVTNNPAMMRANSVKPPALTLAAGNTNAAAPLRHVFAINWENVLMPTAWLTARMGVNTSVSSLQIAQRLLSQNPQLRDLLARIEDRVIQLLTQAMATGPVYLLSEKTVQYVELTCSIFFPRLTACLRNATCGVFVLGVPDTNYSLQEQADWKVNILRTVCYERIFAGQDVAKALTEPATGRFGVVSLCAGDLDVTASEQLKAVAPYVVTKSVKVGQPKVVRPGGGTPAPMSLEDFSTQLETLAKFVKEAVAFNGPIRIAL